MDLPLRWPLVPVDVAAFYLNRPPADVALCCDALWAWDISTRGSTRRQLRIWRGSLLKLQAREHVAAETLEEVINAILPARDPRGAELQQLLYCTAQHIAALHSAGHLARRRAPHVLTGPHASPLYTRASVARFLTLRCIGQLASGEPVRN